MRGVALLEWIGKFFDYEARSAVEAANHLLSDSSRLTAQSEVATPSVIKRFDVLKAGGPQSLAVEPFRLQDSQQTFRLGLIPRASDRTHRR